MRLRFLYVGNVIGTKTYNNIRMTVPTLLSNKITDNNFSILLTKAKIYYIINRHYIEVWLSLVEHCVRDAGVASSNLVTSTTLKPYNERYAYHNFRQFGFYVEVWLSLVERCVRDAEVASSSLVTSTNTLSAKRWG